MDGLDHIKVGPILNSSGPEDKKNVYAWIRYLRICLFLFGKNYGSNLRFDMC